MFGYVFIDGVKEGMTRRAAIGITIAVAKRGVSVTPRLNARCGSLGRNLAALRLKMIGDTYKRVHRPTGRWRVAFLWMR